MLPARALPLLALLATGCAAARFDARYTECTPPADAAAIAAELGMPRTLVAPPDFAEAAAANYAAAPPWVEGRARVYPRDYSFGYHDLPSAPLGTNTPLLCEVTYQAAMRQRLIGGTTRRWLSADKFSGADLTVIFEFPDQGPPLRAVGPRDADFVDLLDPTRHFAEGSVLRFSVFDRDPSLVEFDDALADLELAYADPLQAGTRMRASGATSVRCHHLDPTAAAQARREALYSLDQALQTMRPTLEVDGRDFGLHHGGMHSARQLLLRAASLDRWDDPEIHERTATMLGAQLCFERAAVKAVERKASRARRQFLEPRDLTWQATTFTCAAQPPPPDDGSWPAGPCTLAVNVTNHTSVDTRLYDLPDTLVLAGGREVTVTPQGPPVIVPEATVALTLRLPPSVTANVPLSRPVLVRERRWRLIRKEYDVIDYALRPRR